MNKLTKVFIEVIENLQQEKKELQNKITILENILIKNK